MDQLLEAAVGDLQDGDSDFVQAGSPDGEPRIENSLGDYHHQR